MRAARNYEVIEWAELNAGRWSNVEAVYVKLPVYQVSKIAGAFTGGLLRYRTYLSVVRD